MSRPLLLIVDGESIRTPALESALEADDWAVRWIRSGEAPAFPYAEPFPDLVLLDPSVADGAGYAVARTLRERKPQLPVLALADGPFPHSTMPGPTVDVQVHLDRGQDAETLAAWLRRFHPRGPKLTKDGIFGDPLEGLEGAQAAPAKEPTPGAILSAADPFHWVAAPVQPRAEPDPSFSRPEAPTQPVPIEEYGNYFLLEKIAVGGMAELFKAQQRGVQGFQKIVAIKRILAHFSDNEDFVTMFIDEAKLAAQLTHPNIVQIFDLGKSGNSYYIAMEYVNGRDLRALLKKLREYGRPFPEQVAAFVVMKVAAALDYAHRKRGFDDQELKLVHRDISPQNVILSTEGAVKLVDFGIAKAVSKASHTMAGALKGKLLYMSPEQAMGLPLDNRSDLYSLGLVLFELLTGQRCFQSDSELGVLEKVRLGRIAELTALNPKISREMAAIVNRALQKNVDHRYPSARFMERDLREYLQHQGMHITEHEVAEYMNTLLGGSKEALETLIATRFPLPGSLNSGAPRAVSEVAGAGTGFPPGTVPNLDAPVEASAAQAPGEVGTPGGAGPLRPRWLLPAILVLAMILAAMLIVAGWS
jgi:serine/threonine protein kinase